MRRNLIKVTDEIKEGGRNEDTEDFFSSIPFRIQSGGGGCVWRNWEIEGEKTQTSSFLVHRKVP